MSSIIKPETRINGLPYKIISQLASILDIPGSHDWKAIITVLPSHTYTAAQIFQFEKAMYQPGGSPSKELLKDFGQQLKTVGELITYLEAIDNQEALLLIKQNDPVTIIEHPSPATRQVGQDIKLICKARGFPRPRFQWYNGRSKLESQMSNELHLKNIQQEDRGDYYCEVTNPIGSAYTNVAQLQVIPMIAPIEYGVTGPDPSGSTRSSDRSQSSAYQIDTVVYPYQEFHLTSTVAASSYQWYKNGHPLRGENQQILYFRPFMMGHEGYYSCKVNQNGCEVLTKTANLIIARTPHPDVVNNIQSMENKEFASGKVALIIANKDYPRNHGNEELVHPINDALTLMSKLQEINFNVFCFVNLSKIEMEKVISRFCSILKATPGLYSLFYFCGHGIEEHNSTYLLPIDIPEVWDADSAISTTDVRYQIQECNTKFDLFLFDVCRESAGSESLHSPQPSVDKPFRSGAQCVIGYSTCPQSQAFEIRQDRNGIYMKHLARHISENISVVNLMMNVNEAVREEAELHHLTNSMHPNFSSYTSKSFCLTDRILPMTGYIPTNDPINICFNYHRLPSMQTQQFEYGIICELSFVPVCSNICKVVVFVANFGETRYCDAKIVDIQNRDFDLQSVVSNVERSVLSDVLHRSLTFSERAPSLSSVRSAKVQRETQVAALQRLNGTFTVKVKMEYYLQDDVRHETFQECTFDCQQFGIVAFFD